MRDHVTDELISAYVDGELEGDELKLAESLLAESPEHRQLLAEFQALRASIWSLPTRKLPADFQTRVVSQIEQLTATPPKELIHRGTKARPWRSVLFAAASLAAVVAATVMLNPPEQGPIRPGTGETPFEVPVYLHEEPGRTLVFDVTVTRAGRESKVVERLLRKHGIGVDPTLRLDSKLERELLAHRLPWGFEGPDVVERYVDPKSPKTADEDVEMVYVAAKLQVIDELYFGLTQMREVGKEVSGVHTDLVFENDKMGVMHRLHHSACDYFAKNTDVIPPDDGQAFRLSFSITLKRVSVPGAASFPVPVFGAEQELPRARGSVPPLDVTSDEAVSKLEAFGLRTQLNGAEGKDAGDSQDRDELKPWGGDSGYVLLIVHYVDAEAADANLDLED